MPVVPRCKAQGSAAICYQKAAHEPELFRGTVHGPVAAKAVSIAAVDIFEAVASRRQRGALRKRPCRCTWDIDCHLFRQADTWCNAASRRCGRGSRTAARSGSRLLLARVLVAGHADAKCARNRAVTEPHFDVGEQALLVETAGTRVDLQRRIEITALRLGFLRLRGRSDQRGDCHGRRQRSKPTRSHLRLPSPAGQIV